MPRLSRWRPVGRAGEPYPDWVRDLEGTSGAYAIRSAATGEVWYVGESHTGNLKRTLTRNLQSWEHERAGVTYPRHAVEVAVSVTSDAQATTEQDRLIDRLQPRDNIYLVGPDAEPEPPF